ncbi:MAG: metallophosphoesterase family protein [Anaerolineae bacterium]|jgi:putative phosphoesterase
MRLALLADIHGNGSALRAVLADLDRQGGADCLLVLGDIVLLGPDPAEVVEHLMRRAALAVYGNTDLFLLERDWVGFEAETEEDRADQALCLWALERLDKRAESWLRALPFERRMSLGPQRLLLVHGSPHSVVGAIEATTPDAQVREMIAGTDVGLIFLGHTHTALDRMVDGIRLVNPGSVGCPQGEPGTARYAVVSWDGREWQAWFRIVHYDAEEVIQRLLAAERPYRHWIVESIRQARHLPLDTFD